MKERKSLKEDKEGSRAEKKGILERKEMRGRKKEMEIRRGKKEQMKDRKGRKSFAERK